MKTIILLASLLLNTASSYAENIDPCSQYKNLQQKCSSCSSNKTCIAADRVYCAQLNNYGKQCYYYNKGLQAKNKTVTDNNTSQNATNKSNTPELNLQGSFDTATPKTLKNKLNSYKSDITTSKKMQEIVAPKPTMPKGTPEKAPSATENILKSWY
jgi:hypothetical protein